MATLRRTGFGSIFEVENETVGIGTTGTATNTVQVLGKIDTSNALVSGLSTFTTYQGFVDSNAEFGTSHVEINSQSGTLGNIEICHGQFNVASASTLTSSVNELTVTNSFSVPTGNTNSRVHCHTAGSMRFNEDIGTLEFYTGDEWRTVDSFSDAGNRGRGVFAGGASPYEHPYAVDYMSGKIIDYVQIATLGNAISFGDLTQFSRHTSGFSNHIRGIIYHGSATPGNNNVIDKITLASTGNADDFGLLDGTDTYAKGGAANSTRGVFIGGSPAITDIDYVEIMTDGNTKDFGDLSKTRSATQDVCDGERVVVTGGRDPAGLSTIESFMIASKGDVSGDFGDLIEKRCNGFGVANSTRGVFGGGKNGPDIHERAYAESLNLASGGQTVYFGEVYQGGYLASAASQTRGLIAGGNVNPDSSRINTIHYINITSAGSSLEFGDLSRPNSDSAGLSDCHGGLGGY